MSENEIDVPTTKAEWDAVLDTLALYKPGSAARQQYLRGLRLWGKPVILDADAPKLSEPGSS